VRVFSCGPSLVQWICFRGKLTKGERLKCSPCVVEGVSFSRSKVSVQVSLRGTVFCAEAIPNRRLGDCFATIAPNDDGDCFAKTARNDTRLNGYDPNSEQSGIPRPQTGGMGALVLPLVPGPKDQGDGQVQGRPCCTSWIY